MTKPHRLLDRLDAIGAALAASGDALALLALGSVGVEQDRLDEYSDLDFFAIVKAGHKPRYMADLNWLAAPIAYAFQNTVDGYKVLYEDGIFVEMAIFEPHELAAIPYAAGRIVWQAANTGDLDLTPRTASAPPEDQPLEWRIGEALTNLYVGLGRYHRGEKLSAARFIQQYAVDNILRLAPLIEAEQPAHTDPFNAERRFEQRYPITAAHLSRFVQGYDRSVESAREILAWLEAHFEVNAAMRDAILSLCDEAK